MNQYSALFIGHFKTNKYVHVNDAAPMTARQSAAANQ